MLPGLEILKNVYHVIFLRLRLKCSSTTKPRSSEEMRRLTNEHHTMLSKDEALCRTRSADAHVMSDQANQKLDKNILLYDYSCIERIYV